MERMEPTCTGSTTVNNKSLSSQLVVESQVLMQARISHHQRLYYGRLVKGKDCVHIIDYYYNMMLLFFQLLQPKNMIGPIPKSSFLRSSGSRAKPTFATTIARCLTTTTAASLRSIPTLAELSATSSCHW